MIRALFDPAFLFLGLPLAVVDWHAKAAMLADLIGRVS